MIRKKWVLENKNGGRCADSNEAVYFKPLSTAEPSLPIESALPSLPERVRLPLPEETVMASPEVNTLRGSC